MIESMKNKSDIITGYRARIYGADKKLKSSKTFRQKILAKECERRFIYERDKAIATGITFNESIVLEKFAQKWLDEKIKVRLSISTQRHYESILKNHILPVFGKTLLKDINLEKANRLICTLKEKGKEAKGINDAISVLQGILNEAVNWQYISFNPIRALKPLKEQTKEFAYWSSAEVTQFLRANYRTTLYPYYLTALNTGMRRGELGGLKWDRVDLVSNRIHITRNYNRYGLRESTKTGKKRAIPINPEVRKVLEQQWKLQRSEFVFCNVDGSPIDVQHLSRKFRKAQARAGFTTFIRFHDMRHTFASNFMMNGGNIYDLQKILGHSSLEMTQRYVHLSPAHLENAIRIISFSGESENHNPLVIQSDETSRISVVI